MASFMALSKPNKRKPIHYRHIQCNGYLREDGLWDIEAHLTDDKGYPFPTLQRGVLQPGELVHELWLRLTLDNQLVIQDVEAAMPITPFSICSQIEDNYKRLIGLQIGRGWMQKAKELVGGVEGCSHLIELLRPMATTAIQTIYPYLNFSEDGRFPISNNVLNSCHSFSDTNEIIQQFWPEKYRGQAVEVNEVTDE